MNPSLPTKLLKLIVLMLAVGAVIVGAPSRAGGDEAGEKSMPIAGCTGGDRDSHRIGEPCSHENHGCLPN